VATLKQTAVAVCTAEAAVSVRVITQLDLFTAVIAALPPSPEKDAWLVSHTKLVAYLKLHLPAPLPVWLIAIPDGGPNLPDDPRVAAHLAALAELAAP